MITDWSVVTEWSPYDSGALNALLDDLITIMIIGMLIGMLIDMLLDLLIDMQIDMLIMRLIHEVYVEINDIGINNNNRNIPWLSPSTKEG